MGQLVLSSRANSVAILTLNRTERHNSLVPTLLEEMLVVLEGLETAANVGAVVLQANGRSFSTGGDVAGFYEHMDDLAEYAAETVGLLNQVILALIMLPLPVVAAVHGIVTGGSMGLVLGADVVLVAPRASFTPYYSIVGFSPDGGWTAMLPSLIGQKRAAEILLRNQTITAEQAVAWGLASCIVPAERIRDRALAVAHELAAKKRGSVRHTKRLLSMAPAELALRLEAERTQFVEQVVTEEARQGIAAFLEGRL